MLYTTILLCLTLVAEPKPLHQTPREPVGSADVSRGHELAPRYKYRSSFSDIQKQPSSEMSAIAEKVESTKENFENLFGMVEYHLPLLSMDYHNTPSSSPLFPLEQLTSSPSFTLEQPTSSPLFPLEQLTSSPSFTLEQPTSSPSFTLEQPNSSPSFPNGSDSPSTIITSSDFPTSSLPVQQRPTFSSGSPFATSAPTFPSTHQSFYPSIELKVTPPMISPTKSPEHILQLVSPSLSPSLEPSSMQPFSFDISSQPLVSLPMDDDTSGIITGIMRTSLPSSFSPPSKAPSLLPTVSQSDLPSPTPCTSSLDCGIGNICRTDGTCDICRACSEFESMLCCDSEVEICIEDLANSSATTDVCAQKCVNDRDCVDENGEQIGRCYQGGCGLEVIGRIPDPVGKASGKGKTKIGKASSDVSISSVGKQGKGKGSANIGSKGNKGGKSHSTSTPSVMPSVKATSEGKSKGKTKREISRSPSKMVSPFVANVAIPVIIAGKSSVNREFSYHPSTEPTSFGESTNPLDSRGKRDFKSDEEDAESRIVEGRSEEHQGEISDAESLRLRKRRNRRMKHNM